MFNLAEITQDMNSIKKYEVTENANFNTKIGKIRLER